MLNVVYSSQPLIPSIKDYSVNTRKINSKSIFYHCMLTVYADSDTTILFESSLILAFDFLDSIDT